MDRANGRPSTLPPEEVQTCADKTTENDQNGSFGNGHSREPLSKRERTRVFARKTKEKAKDLFNSDGKETPDHVAVDQISSDPAFNPSLLLNQGPPKLGKEDGSTIKSDLKSAINTVAHPRQAIQGKATRSAAGKISGAQRPFLSCPADRNLLAAHDELDRSASRGSSALAQTSAEGGAETSAEEDAARQKIEILEEQRSSLKVAWTLGKHVDRVKIVQARVPKPLSWDDFVERAPSGEQGRFQWERWLGYQALYHTRGFTARYIDDFEELPFDIEDLSRIVERLVLVSTPWQAWFMSVRQIYTWEDPQRTAKCFALFYFLWYTEHIVGFLYADIIYIVLKNKYHPTSVESVRHSMKRGIDHEAHAQAWGELVEQNGRRDWIEPLLDELGPYIQLQLGDLAHLLEVLTNFYRWKSPWKTAETLFFFGCCLLITFLTDMAFCMKIFWFLAGGWFFLCFPVASKYPKYRYLVDPAKWIFWDIPTEAEWSIEFLQRKALRHQKEIDRREHIKNHVGFKDSESSSSDYETPPNSPRQGVPDAEVAVHGTETFRFRAFQSRSRGHLLISRSGIRFSSHNRAWSIPYNHIIEMCKVKPDSTVKTATFGIAGSGLQFFAVNAQGAQMNESITIHHDKRDEIFNLVLGWSGLRWRTVCIERQRAKTTNGKKKKQLRELV